MTRRNNQLTQCIQEMRDRYGSADPVVLQFQESLAQSMVLQSTSINARIPFGERRSDRMQPSYWNVKLRHLHAPLTRREILAQCRRVELRTGI